MRVTFKRGALAVLLMVVLLVVLNLSRRHDVLSSGPPLPRGKIEPQLISKSDMAALIAPDGSLWVWGGSESPLTVVFDQPTTTPLPQRVGTNSDWRKIAANRFHLLALKSDGSLWAGGKWPGPSVQGSNTSFATPRRVGSDNDWSDIAVSVTHSIALKRDGSLWTWGRNHYGQLGHGTTNDAATPTRVGQGRWKLIGAGAFNTFGVETDGTLWSWGSGLVQNPANHDWVPRQIDPETNWVALSVSDFVFFGLKADGSLWIGGQNARFTAPQYVTNTTAGVTRIGTDSDWKEIHCGGAHFFGRKRDGGWWGFGSNHDGQFGIGGRLEDLEILSPQRLPFNFEPWAMASDDGRTLILLKDGTLWTCGLRLGDPPSSNKFNSLNATANSISTRLPGHRVILPIRPFPADTVPRKLWSLPPEVVRALAEP